MRILWICFPLWVLVDRRKQKHGWRARERTRYSWFKGGRVYIYATWAHDWFCGGDHLTPDFESHENSGLTNIILNNFPHTYLLSLILTDCLKTGPSLPPKCPVHRASILRYTTISPQPATIKTQSQTECFLLCQLPPLIFLSPCLCISSVRCAEGVLPQFLTLLAWLLLAKFSGKLGRVIRSSLL